MKKKLAIFVAGALLALSACGAKPASTPAASQAGMANPMKEISFEEMMDEVGLPTQVPEDAENVRYYVIEGDANPIGQVVFTAGGVEYTLRLQDVSEVEPVDNSGLFYTWAEETTAEVGYCTAQVRKCNEAAVAYWLDVVPGINYSLGVVGEVETDVLAERANQCFAPYQDDTVFEDVLAPAVDYNGTYEAEDGSTVSFVSDGEQYTVEISIVRLCELTGTGSNMDGAVEVELTDPNEGTMYGVFYGNEEGEYTLMITQSTWSLIEDGTEFAGFVLKQ